MNILLACTQRPNYGGASTEVYELVKLFREYGHNTIGLFLDNTPQTSTYFGKPWWDPQGIGGVYPVPSTKHKCDWLPEMTKNFKPDVVLGKNIFAPIFLKHNFPSVKLIYITSGCGFIATEYTKLGQDKSLDHLLSFCNSAQKQSVIDGIQTEKQTIDIVDKIICHSDVVREFMPRFFPNSPPKIFNEVIWTSNIMNPNTPFPPWKDREYQLLFIASHWNRIDKNSSLMRQLVNNFKPNLTYVIGEKANITHNNMIHREYLLRDDVLNIMRKSKVLVVPSIFDASPNIIPEAIGCGCNIVTSKNVRNYFLCNPLLVANHADYSEFVSLIKLALQNEFKQTTPNRSIIYQQFIRAIS